MARSGPRRDGAECRENARICRNSFKFVESDTFAKCAINRGMRNSCWNFQQVAWLIRRDSLESSQAPLPKDEAQLLLNIVATVKG